MVQILEVRYQQSSPYLKAKKLPSRKYKVQILEIAFQWRLFASEDETIFHFRKSKVQFLEICFQRLSAEDEKFRFPEIRVQFLKV